MTAEPEIILGPPGTGKTTTLLGIIEEELAAGTAPDRIAFVTFTRKAAEEAMGRAAEKFGVSRKEFPFFRTLHSLCYRALGMRPAEVFERDRLKEFADYAGVRITGRWAEDGSFAGYEVGDRCMHMENLARVRCTPLREQYERDADALPWSTVDHVSRALRTFKEAHGLADYTDMLARFVREDRPPVIEVLVGDEMQDCSQLQWRVFWLLARHARRIILAGDDDQAIYRWAGADVDYLVDLPGRARVLGQSWRVPAQVQALAGGIIGRVRHRRPKDWAARPASGAVVRAADVTEVDFSGDDVLVLARNLYLIREQIEPELRRRGIVYEVNGRSSVPTAHLRAVVAWEALRRGETVAAAEVAAVYVALSTGPRGVLRGFKKQLDQTAPEEQLRMTDLRERFGLVAADAVWHEALDRIPAEDVGYMLAARRSGEKLLARPRVRVSTIHGAKGGEAESVILLTEMARRTYAEMRADEDDEHRAFYVGCTRAKERLTIVGARTQQYYSYI